MITLLIYDITKDRIRAKIADACLDYGLERIQFSAFFGEISANHLEELLERIRKIAGDEETRVEVFPICEKDQRLRQTLTLRRLRPPARPGRPKPGEKTAGGAAAATRPAASATNRSRAGKRGAETGKAATRKTGAGNRGEPPPVGSSPAHDAASADPENDPFLR